MLILNTIGCLIECWKNAEQRLRASVEQFSPGLAEEDITVKFRETLTEQFDLANSRGEFARTFLQDLEYSLPDLVGAPELSELAAGLIAEVTWHPRSVEKTTGGDFGLLLVRPQISDFGDFLQVADCQRGLLVQAKLKSPKGKWGKLTKNQKTVLVNRTDYLAFALYQYEDEAQHQLMAFQWQSCRGFSLLQLGGFLSKGRFPKLQASREILESIAQDELGTDSPDLIKNFVVPCGTPALIIRVRWPDDRKPHSEVLIYSRQENTSPQVLQQVFNVMRE